MFNWKWILGGFGSDFVLNRQQATTWTSDEQVLWHHMASLGHNELLSGSHKIVFSKCSLQSFTAWGVSWGWVEGLGGGVGWFGVCVCVCGWVGGWGGGGGRRGALVMWTLLEVCCSQGSHLGPRFLSQGYIFGTNLLSKPGILFFRGP